MGKMGRKGIKTLYWVGFAILFALFVASSILYACVDWKWLLLFGAVTVAIWLISSVAFIAAAWSWYIEDLMNEYKKNNNLLSGGLGVLAVFATPFILSLAFSRIDGFTMLSDLFSGISSLMIAAMPAFIGLLGVQYSVAVQERNRREDLRLGAKPFFSVECWKVRSIPDENGHTIHKMEIMVSLRNISQSIGILKKVVSLDDESCETDLKSVPIAGTEQYHESVVNSSIEPYGPSAKIAIYYTDIYKNTYKMLVVFFLHDTASISETRIVSDELVKEK